MSYEFRGQTFAKKQQSRTRRKPSVSIGDDRSLMQILAGLVGLTFLIAGLAGFIPGITSNYDDLGLFGPDSDAHLLGLFRVSVLHNIVHLLFGIGLVAAARFSWAKIYLLGGGVAYLGVVAYGLLIDHSSDANFLPLNTADNLLHLGLSLGMIAAGFAGLAAARSTVR